MFKLKYEPCEAFATINDAFKSHEIDTIRSMFKTKQSAIVGEKTLDKKIRDSYVHWVEVNNDTQWLYEKITAVIDVFNPQYFNVDVTFLENIQLTEYDSEYQGFYGQHCDSSYGNTRSSSRKLSISMQLSDPSEYE